MQKKILAIVIMLVVTAGFTSQSSAMSPELERELEMRQRIIQAQLANHIMCNDLTGEVHPYSADAIRAFTAIVEPPRDVVQDLWATNKAGNDAKHNFKNRK